MGKFGITVAIACAAALAGGWIAGSASSKGAVGQSVVSPDRQAPRLTAMIESAPVKVPPSL